MSESPDDIPDFATLAADPEIAPLLEFAPVPRKVKRPDGWTPELQRELIARIAATGTVQEAVWQMGKHATGAEALYKTPDRRQFPRFVGSSDRHRPPPQRPRFPAALCRRSAWYHQAQVRDAPALTTRPTTSPASRSTFRSATIARRSITSAAPSCAGTNRTAGCATNSSTAAACTSRPSSTTPSAAPRGSCCAADGDRLIPRSAETAGDGPLVERFRAGGVLAHLPNRFLDGAGGGDAGDQLALQLGGPAVGAFHLPGTGANSSRGAISGSAARVAKSGMSSGDLLIGERKLGRNPIWEVGSSVKNQKGCFAQRRRDAEEMKSGTCGSDDFARSSGRERSRIKAAVCTCSTSLRLCVSLCEIPYLTRSALRIFTGGSSIWPFIAPSPLVGETGDPRIAFTTSMPSTTRPKAAKPLGPSTAWCRNRAHRSQDEEVGLGACPARRRPWRWCRRCS